MKYVYHYKYIYILKFIGYDLFVATHLIKH